MALPATAGGTTEEVRTQAAGEVAGMRVTIEEGEEYLHKLKVLPLIRVKSPPQVAIWTETQEGEFIETLYVTERAGEQSWRSAPLDSTPTDKIQRPEALPVWQHRSGGGKLDGRTAATPKAGYDVVAGRPEHSGPVRVFLEVNHSTDFNEKYRKDEAEDSPFYSGGPWGSGQPSLVYSAFFEPREQQAVRLELMGHGSPDGGDGEIRRTVDGITTARNILEWVEVSSNS